jgi:hypothetical protein
MNLSALSKKERTRLLLGAMGLLLLVVSLYMFVLTPWTSRRAKRKADLQEVNAKIMAAEQAKSRMVRAQQEASELRSRVAPILAHHLPPAENTFLWTTRAMDEVVRREGVSLDAINELTTTTPEWVRSPAATRPSPTRAAAEDAGESDATPASRSTAKKMFGPYRAVCTISGDFRDMVAMLERLHMENPMVSIYRMTIISDGKSLRQKADLAIEWPQHAGPIDPTLAEFLLSEPSMDIVRENP